MCIVIFWDTISVVNICGIVDCLMIFWTKGTWDQDERNWGPDAQGST